MGVLIHLNESGHNETLWGMAKNTVRAAKKEFDNLVKGGNVMYAVGEHENIETCPRCQGSGSVKADPNAVGERITEFKENACEINVVKRTVGG